MPTTHALTTFTIDLSAIVENYHTLCTAAKPAACGAVVKANAYGLGIAHVAPALSKAGCNDFFVATLDEAIELRSLLPTASIYIFFGVFTGEEDILCKHALTPILNTHTQIELWNNHAESLKKPLPAIIHIDTGMNRLGINMHMAEKISQQPDSFANLDVKYIMSHLACISEPDHPLNAQQFSACTRLDEIFPHIPKSYNNSGGTFHNPNKGDLCRPGISLFGSNPVANDTQQLKHVITLESQIIQTNILESAETIGYGATAKVPEGSVVATVPVGYADGYIRSLGNQATAFIAGHEVKQIGRISMDSITFDITNIPPELQQIGTKIELIGNNITVDKLAAQAGTIGYEILTNLGSRYARHYIGG